MKLASGGRCKVCKDMFVSLRRLRPHSIGTELHAIDFAEEFVDLLRSGTKTATTRLLRDEPSLDAMQPGDRVRASCHSAGMPALMILRITKRAETTLSELTDELAGTEGMEDASELREVLRGFYPTLSAQDSLTVFHFSPDT